MDGKENIVHDPVLLEEILDLFHPQKADSLFIDGTLGEGGHTEGFLKHFPEITVLGIERDREILEIARTRLVGFGGRVHFFNEVFTDFFKHYQTFHNEAPDRILFDLGISKYHYKKSRRGFTFDLEQPLDMRLDDRGEYSAGDIVNTFSQEDLASIFREYGEERLAKKIAFRILREREKGPVEDARALAEIIRGAYPPKARHGKLHPATRCFQALRIAVNRELENLKEVLEDSFRVLKPGGRLGVISYHSLEDRIVKRFFKEKSVACTCPPEYPVCKCGGKKELLLVTRKPLIPGADEIDRNRAARSAKLRVIEKL